MEKKINILIAGASGNPETVLKKILDETIYTLFFAENDTLEKTLTGFKPDLVIGLLSKDQKQNRLLTDSIAALSRETKIESVYLVPDPTGEAFLQLLINGISDFIVTPVTKKNLFDIIRDKTESPPASNLKTQFSGTISQSLPAEKTFKLNITPEKAGPLVYSLLQNLKNQQRLALKTNIPETGRTRIKDKNNPIVKKNKTKETENMLWETLENDRFRLFYQPVISLKDDCLAGFESLIRIESPDRGIVSPGEFIEIAEQSAVIFPLGLWIIEEASRQIAEWKKSFTPDLPLRINVNISPKQFIHPGLSGQIFEITEKYSIQPEDLGFELTESAFMDDMEMANLTLLELKSKNFPLYMDDFGTGYSSLSYLSHFPVNVIKIDQSFVKWMHIDDFSEKLVRGIISLAHSLELRVVAEGVDDEEHVSMLRAAGCDYIQGYLISKPLPADEAGEFIRKNCRFQDKEE